MKKILLALVFLYISLFTYYIVKSFYTPKIQIDLEKPKVEIKEEDKPLIIFPKTYSKQIPIFTYHYVEQVVDKNDTNRIKITINPATFEYQIKTLLEKNYSPIFMKEIEEKIKEKSNTKYVVLTFDDGYRGFYTDAFPIIKKYKLKTTLYVIYNFLGRSNYLTKQQLAEIANSGLVEIGSHTLNHADLLSNKEENIIREITLSKELLEKDLGIKVTSFCYPYGKYDSKTLEYVKNAGYLNATTLIEGDIQTSDNLFELKRIRAGGLIYWLK